MINRTNYYQKIKEIDFTMLDEDMNAMRKMVDSITDLGSDWTAYENDATVKETFDLYFKALGLETKHKKEEHTKNKKSLKSQSAEEYKFNPSEAEALFSQFLLTISDRFKQMIWLNPAGGDMYLVRDGVLELSKMPVKFTLTFFRKFFKTLSTLYTKMLEEIETIEPWHKQDWIEFAKEYETYLKDVKKVLPKETKKEPKSAKRKISTIAEKSTSADEKTAALAFKMDLKNHFHHLKTKGIKKSDVPSSLVSMWDIVERISKMKNPYQGYSKSPRQKEHIDRYIEKMRDFAYTFDKHESKKSVKTQNKTETRRKTPRKSVKVEEISLELKFIKRFINMDKKMKSRRQIRLFINGLQKAIQAKQITKSSQYAKQIMEIQEKLIAFHSRFKNETDLEPVVFTKQAKDKFEKLIKNEIQLHSVKLIKSYINLQGKVIPNIKAQRLFNRISKDIEKGKVTKRDKYWNEIDQILSHLEVFIQKNPDKGILKVEPRALNGLHGIVGCCTGKKKEPKHMNIHKRLPSYLGIEKLTEAYTQGKKVASDNRFIMSSEDLMKVNFNHIGLKDKWLDFIGDPEIGFRLATFGAPKMGKSYLMIEFAGYLAANHGKVLYVAKEEGKSATLKKKLAETLSAHPNMMVSNYIPENLGDYDFAFFDSVTKLGLTADNLMAISTAFPKTATIEVHQVTKDGKARGVNDFIHDVDGIIEVYEKGRARQKGRFNQGGELDFFDVNAA